MSCAACEKMMDKGFLAPYRWKAATVGIMACPDHACEIIMALNTVQGISNEGECPQLTEDDAKTH